MKTPHAIKIAITAIGGQGGGVLAGWIGKLGECNGYIAQTTSVPGVAQRTGATIYYVELFPDDASKNAGKAPVLALSPVPGDLDIVIAAELAEAGRALVRGFVTSQTVLIASSHRDFAIGEKSGMGDGRIDMESIVKAANENAKAFIHADMQQLAVDAGTVISASLFGAVAGSGALPFTRAQFEQQIKDMGRAVEANLKGFASGFDLAKGTIKSNDLEVAENQKSGPQATPKVRYLLDRLNIEIPEDSREIALEGLKRAVNFQDIKYAGMYLDRLRPIVAADKSFNFDAQSNTLTKATAKHLAVWMCYDDAIRVADQKVRRSRFDRVRDDIRADTDQIFHLSEYMHPRVEEICDILPSSIAKLILNSKFLQSVLRKILGEGKRVSTTRLRGYLPLYALSLMRPIRRSSHRFLQEQIRIDTWLDKIVSTSTVNYDLAVEIARMQRLIKGYGDTHKRGLTSFDKIMAALPMFEEKADASQTLDALCKSALADEDGLALKTALDDLGPIALAA